MSVTWRRLEHFVASFGSDRDRNDRTARSPDAATRRAGMARLEAAFRSPSQQQLPDVDWLPKTRAVVSR
jgi:hypothetical protein